MKKYQKNKVMTEVVLIEGSAGAFNCYYLF
jgi:hypothetical protein